MHAQANTVVMIPCRNEADSIGDLVERTLEHAGYVVVADDNSTDCTAAHALEAGASVVCVPKTRRGLAGVYAYGLARALHICPGAMVAEMDAGDSHDPASLPGFWEALSAADVVTGCRFGQPGAVYQGHWQRKALSWGGTLLTNLINDTNFDDATSGFIAYRPHALEKLLSAPWKATGHYYQTELRLRALAMGLKVVEHPIHYRNSGTSLNWRSIREALALAAIE